jgi:alpha-1,3-rhamnosyl/mannosyltransferase
LERLFEQFRSVSRNNKVSSVNLPFPPKFFEYTWNSLHFPPIELYAGSLDVYHSSDWTQAPSKAFKVTTVHDVMPFLFPERFHERIIQAHKARWKWIQKEIDALIVDAEVTKQDIVRLFSLDPSRISVVPLGCDQRFFRVGAAKLGLQEMFGLGVSPTYFNALPSVLKKYSLSADSYILAVGTLEPRKNIERLIAGFEKIDKGLQKQYPLVVVGKKAWAESLGKHEHVYFTGYVDDVDLPYVYGGAKMFVMPSLYEGFGLPVLEAMASATPVVCSNRSSLPEIGGDEVHYIEDAEDVESIRMILEHVLTSEESELAEVAKNAYNRAKQFSWERTARETLAVYQQATR